MARPRFSQKTNKGSVKKIIRSIFGRIYGATICLRFYLTFNESANFLWCSLFWWFSNKRKKRKLISFKMSAHINMSERGHGVKQDKKRATTAIFSTFLADLLPVQKKVLCYPNRWCRRARKTRWWWAQKLTLIKTEKRRRKDMSWQNNFCNF